MEEHLKATLKKLIEQVIETGEAVGSQHLVAKCKLDVSPATIRNYFVELEELGYIMQPHTSSGRLPTEKGYQYYVDNLLKPRALSKKEITELDGAAKNDATDNRRIKALARCAADLAQNAVVVGLGEADSYYTGLSNLFGQSEFKDWNRIVSMSDVLDRLDEVLIKLRQAEFKHPTALIGNECPFGPMCSSVIVSQPDGSLIGILGPMRMDYSLSISLIEKISQLYD
ncbi:MAG: hypothetical protein WCW31_04880 [Patescibacteria group bacterium]